MAKVRNRVSSLTFLDFTNLGFHKDLKTEQLDDYMVKTHKRPKREDLENAILNFVAKEYLRPPQVIRVQNTAQPPFGSTQLTTNLASSQYFEGVPVLWAPMDVSTDSEQSSGMPPSARKKRKQVKKTLDKIPSYKMLGSQDEIYKFVDRCKDNNSAKYEIDEVLRDPTKNDIARLFWFASAKSGNAGLVKFMHSRKPGLLNETDGDGDTALTFSANHHYFNVVEYLIQKKADINIRNKEGWSALMCAASVGNAGIVRLLMEREEIRTDFRVEVAGGGFGLKTALELAVSAGWFNVVTEFKQIGGTNLYEGDVKRALELAASEVNLAMKNKHNPLPELTLTASDTFTTE
ncbi:hypothetical protein HDU93_007439, partial [Gonapodya sp. JEL0774]